MVYKEPSEGKQYKPRGRPFPKGNKRGKLENRVLDDSGHTSSIEGGVVAPSPQSPVVSPLYELPALVMNITDSIIKENMETPVEAKEEEISTDKTIETMKFKNGDNTLSIRFSSVNNRRYRIQVFLNEETEVRPVTYQGSTSGYAFWKLLKGALKK